MKMKKINLKDYEEVVKYAIENGLTLYAEGRAGIGKSQMVHKVANELGKKVIDIRAILYDVGDLVMKIPNKDHTELKEIITSVLPKEQGYVILLDEFRHAPTEVRRLLYQLILDKKLSTYELPAGTPVIALSNKSDEVDTEELESPLWDRWVLRVEVEPSFDEWKDWAMEQENGAIVVGYLEAFREDFYIYDQETNTAHTTPRRWEMVMKHLHVSDYILPPATATRFNQYLENVEFFKDIEAYVKGKKKLPDDLSKQYAFASAVIQRISSEYEKSEKLIDHLFDMKFKGIREEIQAFLLFSVLKIMKIREKKTPIQLILDHKNGDKILQILKRYKYLIE